MTSVLQQVISIPPSSELFNASKIKRLSLFYYPDSNRCTATIEFKHDTFSGEKRIDGEGFDTTMELVKQFLQEVQ